MLQPTQKRFLLAAPLIGLPFLCGIFYALGGGHGKPKVTSNRLQGLNTELPGAFPDPKKAFLDKVNAYQKADQDSQRKKEYAQQDPYQRYLAAAKAPDSIRRVFSRKPAYFRPVFPPDPRADELLRQLDRLKATLQQRPSVTPVLPSTATPVFPRTGIPGYSAPPIRQRLADTPERDPQLERLNTMLDKVIRIQHPGESRAMSDPLAGSASEAVIPADSSSNAIAAVIPNDQTLVSGGTIPLRLVEDVLMHGVRIISGSWLYGVATIGGDRLLVHVRSIRDGRNLYPTDLQVYDLDGLPGIHIPDVLSQDVAKESASESVSGLNLVAADPTIGAAAAEAGIQATKSLLARKARLIKVSVRAGYEVLLKNSNSKVSSVISPTMRVGKRDSLSVPGFVPGGSFMERSRSEGVELALRGIYLKDTLLWFALEWQNHTAIDYRTGYLRWYIRDKRSFKRTAQQELTVDPSYSTQYASVVRDSTLDQWAGFRPFAPGKDKELVLEAGEKDGGRVLKLVIRPKEIIHAKNLPQ
jgi:hypothetical protein